MKPTLGLAIAAQILLLLGILGWIGIWVFVPVAIVVVLVAISPDSGQRVADSGIKHEAPRGAARSRRLLSAVRRPAMLAIAAIPLVALALYPPVAFDETLYHLPTVRAIATSGAIRWIPDLRFPAFPQLHEALCAPVFLAFGDTATHFVAVIEILLLAALMFEWRGLLAAALVLGNPIVMQIGSVTYVDAALMLFVAAGFYCLDHEQDFWAGFLLGTACSVKYLGLYFAVAGAVYAWRRAPRYLAGLVLGMLPMYGWLTLTTHNPLFPFFGSSVWNPHLIQATGNPLRVLWDITFARGRVNWQPPYSPLFAISLLVTIVLAFRNRKAAFIATVCVGYIAIFTFLPQDSRYLLPLLPLVSAVCGGLLPPRIAAARCRDDREAQASLRNPGRRQAAALLCVVVALPGFAYAAYRVAKQGVVSRRAYIEQRLPEIRALEHRGPGRTWLCGAEQLKYYGGENVVGDVFGPYRTMPPDTRYVLIAKQKCAAPPGFRLVYTDTAAELWAR